MQTISTRVNKEHEYIILVFQAKKMKISDMENIKVMTQGKSMGPSDFKP